MRLSYSPPDGRSRDRIDLTDRYQTTVLHAMPILQGSRSHPVFRERPGLPSFETR